MVFVFRELVVVREGIRIMIGLYIEYYENSKKNLILRCEDWYLEMERFLLIFFWKNLW